MTAETRSLLVLPLFHVNGIMVSVVSPLLAGGSTFIAERFHAASFWATVEQVRPTFFSAVPTIYALLTSQPGARPDIRSLRRDIPKPLSLVLARALAKTRDERWQTATEMREQLLPFTQPVA